MSRLLYTLEDYFDALADRQKGHFLRWPSRFLSNAFAVIGDVWQANAGTSSRSARAGFLRSLDL